MIALRSAAAATVSHRKTPSLPRPLIPEDAYAFATSDAVPSILLTLSALTVPVVFASIRFRALAVVLVSDRITSAVPKPLIPEDA